MRTEFCFHLGRLSNCDFDMSKRAGKSSSCNCANRCDAGREATAGSRFFGTAGGVVLGGYLCGGTSPPVDVNPGGKSDVLVPLVPRADPVPAPPPDPTDSLLALIVSV